MSAWPPGRLPPRVLADLGEKRRQAPEDEGAWYMLGYYVRI